MPDRLIAAHHRDGKIVIAMESGVEISFPVAGNPRLEGQPPALLDQIEISPYGLHWPALDEDLSIRGILAGHYGQRPSEAA
jgi:hypothetical protein